MRIDTPERYRINTTSFDYYWKKGVGASLLERLGFTPDIRNAEQYKHYYLKQTGRLMRWSGNCIIRSALERRMLW